MSDQKKIRPEKFIGDDEEAEAILKALGRAISEGETTAQGQSKKIPKAPTVSPRQKSS